MANSVIRLFSNCEIEPTRNMIVDDIEVYLDSLGEKALMIQFFKPTLEATVTLDFADSYISESEEIFYNWDKFNYNYVSVSSSFLGSRKVYYFVTGYDWKSKSTIRLYLKMDVLNTFQNDIREGFTDRTSIIREHVDRFDAEKSYRDEAGNWSLLRKVDKENEDIDVPKFYVGNKNAFNVYSYKIENNQFPKSWYLIYKNDTFEEGSPDTRSPIKLNCVYEDELKITNGTGNYGEKTFNEIFANVGSSYEKLYFLNTYYYNDSYRVKIKIGNAFYYPNENKIIKMSWSLGDVGVSVSQLIYQNGVYKGTTDIGFIAPEQIKFIDCQFAYQDSGRDAPNLTEFDSIKKLNKKYILAGAEGSSFIPGITSIDRTDPKLIKIIKLPYAPTVMSLDSNGCLVFDTNVWFKASEDEIEFSLEMYNTAKEMENKDIEGRNGDGTFFSYILDIPKQANEISGPFNYLNESKLLNSAFTEIKLVYDNFEYNLPLEYNHLRIDPGFGSHEPVINFKPTNTINSNFIFSIDSEITGEPLFDSGLSFPSIIAVRRNNEVLIMNSPYLNYVNNGYNYDKKHRKMDIATGIVGNVIGLAGQGVAMATGGVSGSAGVLGAKFGSALISDTIGTVVSSIKSEDAIKRRLTDLNNSSVNISGSDDIDLLSYYSDNKLWYKSFMIREELQKNIAYLFHLIGYSHPYIEYPNITSRKWFNFLQCKPEFDSEVKSVIRKDLLDEIKRLFNEGVTFFHHVGNMYDFEQFYENWESWII